MRVGPWFEPFRNSRSPLTLAIQERRRTWRRPVRRWRSSDGAAALVGVEHDLDVEVVERRRRRARAATRGAGRSIVTVHSTSFAPGRERLVGDVVDAAERAVHATPCAASSLSSVARSTSTARSAVASRHSARSRAMRTGPVSVDAHRPPDAARVPVGVEAVPVLEDAGEVALGGEVGRAGAGHLDGEVVLAAGAQRVGHLEGVREEVALGVAEVGAVEPDVALVEEAVEGRARRAGPRPGPSTSNERR